MDVDEPNLEVWRKECIEAIETAGLGQLTSNQDQDESRSERQLGNVRKRFSYQDREMSEASTATLQHISQTRESTATLRGVSDLSEPHLSSSDAMDIDMQEASRPSTAKARKPTIIVATDFGTTFSSVAFAMREEGWRPMIKIVANYPDDARARQGRPSLEVPTESWYPDAAQLAELDMEMNLNNQEDIDLYGISDQDEEEDDYRPDDDFLAVNGGNDEFSTNAPRNFFWGYGIQKLIAPDMDPNQFDRVARSKLLLDTKAYTQEVRDELRPVIQRLRRRRIINEDGDVIADYLTQLFIHAKKQIMDVLEMPETTSVEHVLCVPIIWSSKALRTMQSAMKCAIQNSGLGGMENLFLVSEPEAAAAYVLGQSDEVDPGEAFLILDAGGGTVDATTYMVDKQYPLRLSKELVDPKGCLHGSSYLNADFRQHLLTRLEGEKYLERDNFTIEGIVDGLVLMFENHTKRTLDVNDKNTPTERITVQGLRADDRKGFGVNRLFVTRNDFYRIFMPHLTAIGKLMKEQLEAAKEKGYRVQKVVLIGGFSGSLSLRNYLKNQLKVISRAWEYQIRLVDSVDTEAPETAVAHGAILRALSKDHGPARIPQSSYGFLRSEPFGEWPEHRGVRPSVEKLDGYKYVTNTIDWLVKKDSKEPLPPHAEYAITAYHIFSTTRKYFRCEEILYVSDSSTKSHYRNTHPNNHGAEIAGRIIADMSFLVTEGRIEAIEPDPGVSGKRHYKIEFELVMIIDGRNLRYEARWPVGGEVRSGGQICIAAAFRPGTG